MTEYAGMTGADAKRLCVPSAKNDQLARLNPMLVEIENTRTLIDELEAKRRPGVTEDRRAVQKAKRRYDLLIEKLGAALQF